MTFLEAERLRKITNKLECILNDIAYYNSSPHYCLHRECYLNNEKTRLANKLKRILREQKNPAFAFSSD